MRKTSQRTTPSLPIRGSGPVLAGGTGKTSRSGGRAPDLSQPGEVKEKGRRGRQLASSAIPYVLIAPVFVYYLVFWIRPVLAAVTGSFLELDGSVTLEHYLVIFRDEYFRRALFNTLFIVALSVTLEFFVAFGLALLINTRFRGSSVFLSVALIPMALPAVAVGAMWSSGFATYGWLNSLLYYVGLIEADCKIAFLSGGPYSSMLLIVLIDAWQVIPFMMVILLAGMQNLNRELLEAGYVFGATPFVVLREIAAPLLRPTIQTALVLRIISAVQIWLIIVMLFGFRRIPVLLEELVFYKEVLTGPEHFKIALAYSVLVAAVVSAVAILYLKVSGALRRSRLRQEYAACAG